MYDEYLICHQVKADWYHQVNFEADLVLQRKNMSRNCVELLTKKKKKTSVELGSNVGFASEQFQRC